MKRVLTMMLALAAGSSLHAQDATNTGSGAILRGLDKLTGRSSDIEIASGGTARFNRIEIALQECRYPEGDPAGDAFAFVTVRDLGDTDQSEAAAVFRGWMVASAPALNAMDHQRYDVWVLRCTTS